MKTLVFVSVVVFQIAAVQAAAGGTGDCVSVSNTATSCFCPDGTGLGSSNSVTFSAGATPTTALVLCDDLLPGYALTAAVASGALWTGTTLDAGLPAGLVVCPVGKYCPGATGVFNNLIGPTTALTSATAAPTNTATGQATACPAYATGTLTKKSTLPTACTDLKAGYAFVAAAAGASALPASCATAGTYCPGVANVFVASPSITGLTAATPATSMLLTGAAGSEALTGTYTLVSTANAVSPLVAQTCPAFSTGTATSGLTSLAACTDLKAGYAFAVGATQAATAIPTSCATAGTYCPGVAGVFATGTIGTVIVAGSGVTPVGAAGSLVIASATALTNTFTVVAGAATAQTCPAGTTGTATSGLTSLAACTDLAAGYAFTASQTATNTPTLTVCANGNYGCAGAAGVFKASAQTASTGITYVGSSVISTFTLTSATVTTLTIAGTSIAALASGTNILASCPTGTTNAVTNGADISSCTAVAAGYYVPTTASTLALSTSTAVATGGVAACTAGNYCVVTAAKVTYTASGSTYTWAFTAYTPTACPAGTTWAGSASSSATSAAVCDDLAAGYYIPTAIAAQAAAGAVTALTTGIQQCPVGSYCTGSVGAIALTNGGITAGTTGNTFIWGAVVASPATPCVAGSSTSAVGSTASSACTLVAPGYYIDHSALNTPVVCPAGEYCPGGGAIGTVGGDMNCPLGSGISGTTGSVTNSNINDCIVSAGFYIAASAVNTPVPCPSGYICTGGGAVGTAGGSVACPTGSTNAACLTPAVPANTTTTVNGAPVTVSPAAVTVSPAAVTVSPAAQPITVNVTVPAPIFSAAPRAAAHAAVLALTALAALVAF